MAGGDTARRLWNTVVATVFHNPRGSMPQIKRRLFVERVYGLIAGGGIARRLWNTVVATVSHNPRGSMP